MARRIGAVLLGLSLIVGVEMRPATAQEISTPAVTTPSDSLPPLPSSGYGIPAPTAPVPSAVVPAPAAPSLGLRAPGFGVVPLQQDDPNAPAFLIRPSISVGETLTDNVRATATSRTGDLESRLSPALSISADTPRLQAVLSAGVDAYKYAFATDQDRELLNLFGSGTATILPDTFFLDLRSSITQGSVTGGLGFSPVSQQPKNQTSQVFTTSLSPYLRQSYGGLVDGELRYNFVNLNSGGTGLTPASSTTRAALSDSTTNEATLTLTTGRDFTRLRSRLTLDASKLDSSSLSRSTSLTAYDDVEYRIVPNIAALGRVGYEDIRFGGLSSANTTGAAWQIGGRVDFGADANYALLNYGKQQGIYGFSGSLRYEITPLTVLTADASQGLGSQQQQIGANLSSAQFDPTTGKITDANNLPIAIVNPDFALQNQVTRSKRLSVSLTTTIDPNHFSLFGTYERRSSLSAVTPPQTTIGVHFDWGRDIRPNLTGHMAIGYSTTSNLSVAPPGSPTTITTISNSDTVSGDLSLNYTFTDTLSGSIVYTLLYQANGATLTAANTIGVGNVLTNRLTFLLSKTF